MNNQLGQQAIVTTQLTHGAPSVRDVAGAISNRLHAAIRGRGDEIELIVIALLADGHVLLEDFPGSGKTILARVLGESVVSSGRTADLATFRRIQFTPDLLPSDITGTTIFDVQGGVFEFRRGPVFAHIVLADEINRTSPKVQAALLEAMAEKQVTVDNTTHKLDDLFLVIATQNPVDLAGTYPLPTPQLDRFLFKIVMHHIERDAELEVLAQYPSTSMNQAINLPTVTADELVLARRAMREGVHIADEVRESLVDIARALRADDRVLQGASTRSLVLMLPALQARAAIYGRDYVSPDDVDALVVPVFQHRIQCIAGLRTVTDVIRDAAAPQLERLARFSLAR